VTRRRGLADASDGDGGPALSSAPLLPCPGVLLRAGSATSAATVGAPRRGYSGAELREQRRRLQQRTFSAPSPPRHLPPLHRKAVASSRHRGRVVGPAPATGGS
jgi:hypothetical protein